MAASILEACSRAENLLNVTLGDVEYAAATDAHPVWEPGPVPQAQLAPFPALAVAA